MRASVMNFLGTADLAGEGQTEGREGERKRERSHTSHSVRLVGESARCSKKGLQGLLVPC